MIKEYALKTNSFKEPVTYEDNKAIGILILRLLILEPGKNILYPQMGVGLGTKYRYITDAFIPDLESIIQNQINVYLPEYQVTNIKLSLSNTKILTINIYIQDELYVYTYDGTVTLSEIYKKENKNG